MDFALARYLPDGQLDATFGGTGKVITDAGSDGDVLSGVVLESDGAIVVVGTVGDDFAVARYVP